MNRRNLLRGACLALASSEERVQVFALDGQSWKAVQETLGQLQRERFATLCMGAHVTGDSVSGGLLFVAREEADLEPYLA